MALALQVYRRFYHINIAPDNTSSYTLIDPTSLSATVRNITQGNLVIEANTTIVPVSTGLYYADLTSALYNSDDEYEIDWQVQYVPAALTRSVYTRFKFPINNGSTGNVVVRELDIEMVNPLPLEITLESRTLNYVIESTT